MGVFFSRVEEKTTLEHLVIKADVIREGIKVDSSLALLKNVRGYIPTVFDKRHKKTLVPSDIVLKNGSSVVVWTREETPYILVYDKEDDKVYLVKNGKRICEVKLFKRPRYYDEHPKLAEFVSPIGYGVMGVTYAKYCILFESPFRELKLYCKFCSIRNVDTKVKADVNFIVENIHIALFDKDSKCRYVLITSGNVRPFEFEEFALKVIKRVSELSRNFGGIIGYNVSWKYIDKLIDVGVKAFAFAFDGVGAEGEYINPLKARTHPSLIEKIKYISKNYPDIELYAPIVTSVSHDEDVLALSRKLLELGAYPVPMCLQRLKGTEVENYEPLSTPQYVYLCVLIDNIRRELGVKIPKVAGPWCVRSSVIFEIMRLEKLPAYEDILEVYKEIFG